MGRGLEDVEKALLVPLYFTLWCAMQENKLSILAMDFWHVTFSAP